MRVEIPYPEMLLNDRLPTVRILFFPCDTLTEVHRTTPKSEVVNPLFVPLVQYLEISIEC